MSRLLGIVFAGAALFAFASPASAGETLSIPAARERAASFAERTCAHDASCAHSGVRNCRRLRDRVVLCRIFDHRKTGKQGNFVCTRLVRMALRLPARKIPVTGLSDWDC